MNPVINYTQLLLFRRNENKGKSCLLKVQNHPKVMIHKRSICSQCPYFETPYLVYHMILQTSEIFLHDVTLACPWTLLFFGKTLDIVEFEGVSGIRVDSLIKINCFKKTAMLIQVIIFLEASNTFTQHDILETEKKAGRAPRRCYCQSRRY